MKRILSIFVVFSLVFVFQCQKAKKDSLLGLAALALGGIGSAGSAPPAGNHCGGSPSAYPNPVLQTGAGAIPGYTPEVNEDSGCQMGMARSYTDNGNGTITDNVTKLVWNKCSQGLSGSNCDSGSPTSYTWANAQTACTGGTRLPTIEELETLIDYSKRNPVIDSTAFPNAMSSYYWSSMPYAGDSTTVWNSDFGVGLVFYTVKTDTIYVRCVSGPVIIVVAPRFTDNSDGTVKDNNTGLLWQKCSNGQSGNDCSSGSPIAQTWANALSYCNGLNLMGKAWRLPSINELKSILNRNTYNPAIDSVVFPNTVLGVYWGSTTDLSISSSAWSVFFSDGGVAGMGKVSTGYVRCVSGP